MTSVEEFRTGVRSRPRAHLTGGSAFPGGRGGPGREREAFAGRIRLGLPEEVRA
ncbi:hypothetical protein ABZY44_28880 [Streptomyces sp. NPDC006544]|uniref:hypothetical protein n=1 Tax=Streptomyces sp. NPDC006544 TaxID=3154583 RepID=UPI0033B84C29